MCVLIFFFFWENPDKKNVILFYKKFTFSFEVLVNAHCSAECDLTPHCFSEFCPFVDRWFMAIVLGPLHQFCIGNCVFNWCEQFNLIKVRKYIHLITFCDMRIWNIYMVFDFLFYESFNLVLITLTKVKVVRLFCISLLLTC